MTSRNLYSKLMKEDLKNRLWAVALIGLVFFFAFPVVAAFQAGDLKEAMNYEKALSEYTKSMKNWLSFECGMTVFLMMAAALVCGMSGFSYLNSKSKVDFYHSIPVKREKMFIANYVNGILILAVPYAAALLLAVVIGISNGISGTELWSLALSSYGMTMVYYILMYSLVVVAAMLTGNLVVGVLGSAVLAFYVPLGVLLVGGYLTTFFRTYMYLQYEGVMNSLGRLSPIVEYIYQVGAYGKEGVSPLALIAALAVSAALAALGCLLYQKRPSEAAGRAMAFAVTKPVIRILITVMAALGCGLFFWSLRSTTGWAVFGVLCGGVIAHCVIEIIYHFDFKKLFADKIQLVACLAVSLLVMLTFRYDWIGYDEYLPDAGEVKEAAIDIYALNSWVSYGEAELQKNGEYGWISTGDARYIFNHMKESDVESILAIAQAGIRRQEDESSYQERRYSEEDAETLTGVGICYTLNNGRKVYRNYWGIDLNEVLEPVEKIYVGGAYKAGAYPVMNLDTADVAEVRYRELGPEVKLNQMTAEEKKELLEAFKQDFANLSIDRMKKEAPVGLIRFVSVKDAQALAWEERAEELAKQNGASYHYYRGFDEKSFYPVYPSFEHTIRVLERYGIEPGAALDSYEVKSADVTYYVRHKEYTPDSRYDGEYYEEAKYLVINDQEELETLKAGVVLYRATGYYNPLYKTENIEITLNSDGGDDSYLVNVRIPKGQIPAFLQTKIDEGSKIE